MFPFKFDAPAIFKLLFFVIVMHSDRQIIVRLFQEGRKQADIARSLGISRQLVSKAIARFRETGTNEDRVGRGRTRSATSAAKRGVLKRQIRSNPRRSVRDMAKALGVSKSSIHRMLKDDLGLKAYKLQEAHLLDHAKKATRLERCKILKRRFSNGRHRSIVFSDEKLFTIEQAFNVQNDRLWSSTSPSPEQRRVGRSQSPKSVMVWAGITHSGKTPLVFVEEGVKVNGETYRTLLERTILPWAKKHFGDEEWTFQQDSAPAHRASTTQAWIRSHFPKFITPQEWPPYSPDLNPMDYSIWSILQARACTKPHDSIQSLKRALKKEWGKLSLEMVSKIVDNFPKRLKLCVDANGGHFE